MPEHQQTQQPIKTDNTSQKHTLPPKQIPTSHPAAIIQRARINPKSLTHVDVMQLQRTIGNGAVGRLLSEIGLIPSITKQAPPVQMQTIPEETNSCPLCMQRPEIPEEEEPLQRKMADALQRQEISEEDEPLQGKIAEAIQRQEIPEEEEPLQVKFAEPIQRQEIPEEEKPLQSKFENEPEQEACPPFSTFPIQKQKENRTGMPDNLKDGVENFSGIDMSDVRVHYNSSKPAEVGALAYTQGTNIHVAPGQERHLPHEAWHVVQQAQGRVQPTMQLKDVMVNDDVRLEQEADVMGEKGLINKHNNQVDLFESLNTDRLMFDSVPIQLCIHNESKEPCEECKRMSSLQPQSAPHSKPRPLPTTPKRPTEEAQVPLFPSPPQLLSKSQLTGTEGLFPKETPYVPPSLPSLATAASKPDARAISREVLTPSSQISPQTGEQPHSKSRPLPTPPKRPTKTAQVSLLPSSPQLLPKIPLTPAKGTVISQSLPVTAATTSLAGASFVRREVLPPTPKTALPRGEPPQPGIIFSGLQQYPQRDVVLLASSGAPPTDEAFRVARAFATEGVLVSTVSSTELCTRLEDRASPSQCICADVESPQSPGAKIIRKASGLCGGNHPRINWTLAHSEILANYYQMTDQEGKPILTQGLRRYRSIALIADPHEMGDEFISESPQLNFGADHCSTSGPSAVVGQYLHTQSVALEALRKLKQNETAEQKRTPGKQRQNTEINTLGIRGGAIVGFLATDFEKEHALLQKAVGLLAVPERSYPAFTWIIARGVIKLVFVGTVKNESNPSSQ